jgi:BASS family bile acid:Na+ symporter
MDAGSVVDDNLLWLVLGAVAIGVLVPELAAITDYATPILAVMVGSVSLTLTVERLRAVRPRGVLAALGGHVCMPLLAFAVALAALVADGVAVDATRVVEGLVLAVVAPMLAAIAVRHAFEDSVAAHQSAYGTISAAAVVVIIGGVAAANAALLRADPARTATVAVAALELNVAGYTLGYLASTGGTRPTRIATTLSVGMRDFAVAAALVVAAGFPTLASVPAITFGVVEMTTSALLAKRFG